MATKRIETPPLDPTQAWHRVAAAEIDGWHFQLDVRGDGAVMRYGFCQRDQWHFYERPMEAVVNGAYRAHLRALEGATSSTP